MPSILERWHFLGPYSSPGPGSHGDPVAAHPGGIHSAAKHVTTGVEIDGKAQPVTTHMAQLAKKGSVAVLSLSIRSGQGWLIGTLSADGCLSVEVGGHVEAAWLGRRRLSVHGTTSVIDLPGGSAKKHYTSVWPETRGCSCHHSHRGSPRAYARPAPARGTGSG